MHEILSSLQPTGLRRNEGVAVVSGAFTTILPASCNQHITQQYQVTIKQNYNYATFFWPNYIIIFHQPRFPEIEDFPY